MSERLEDLTERVRGVGQLGVVVTAMRGIAAARAQQSRGLLPGIQAYAGVIAQAVAQALRLMPAPPPSDGPAAPSSTMLVLFAAEHGFVGAFSDAVLDVAARHAGEKTLFVVGARGARRAEERGMKPDWQTHMAAHPGSVPATAIRVAQALYGQMNRVKPRRVAMIYPVWSAGAGLRVEQRMLMPIDYHQFAPAPAADAPLVTLPPAVLLERLADEYVFAQLCEGTMRAFAAENEARALAMVRAKTNIEAMLTELQGEERRLRQEAITAEVIELAGATSSSRANARRRSRR